MLQIQDIQVIIEYNNEKNAILRLLGRRDTASL
jgi:hypothetical protein